MARQSTGSSLDLLIERLTPHFASAVRTRGESYFRSGHVCLRDDGEGWWAVADVQGSHTYLVVFDIAPKRNAWDIMLDCDCPYMDSFDGFCKHIWAVLLTLQAKRPAALAAFGAVPKRVNPKLLETEWQPEFDDEGPLDVDDSLTVPFPLVGGEAGDDWEPAYETKKKSEPQWIRWFRSIPSSRGARNDPLQTTSPIVPLYVLDLSECKYQMALVICLCQQNVTRSGKLGKVKRLPLGPVDIPRLSTETDRKIGLLLLGADSLGMFGGYSSSLDLESVPRQSEWTMRGAFQEALLPLLAASDRFFWRTQNSTGLTAIRWDDGPPWELLLSVEAAPRKKGHQFGLSLRRDDSRKVLDAGDHLIGRDATLLLSEDTLCRVDTHHCGEWAQRFQDSGPVPIKQSELPKLLEELSRFDSVPPIEWPADWAVHTVTDQKPLPRLDLHIGKSGRDRESAAAAKLSFIYGDLVLENATPGDFAVDAKQRHILYRRRAEEEALFERLFALGAKRDYYKEGLEVPQRRLHELVTTLVQEGWLVFGDTKLFHAAGDFKIEVTTGIDWFDVNGHVEFGDQQASMPELLAALGRGDKFVRLGDGSSGVLPEEWLNRHRGWMDLGHIEDGAIRFAKTQIGLIDALLAEMPEATFDRELAEARERIAGFSGIEPCREPKEFRGELRPYQREGLGWLQFLDGFGWSGCLADDMGLGKTVQILGLLADRKRQADHGPSLVVAPKSVVFNWVREAARFAPNLSVIDYTGIARQALRDALPQCDLVVTTYGTLRRDIKFLADMTFNYVILDEAQAIKNPSAQSTKAARILRARRRLALTGTPVENHLGDLWSILEFLNPGMLGHVNAFKKLAGVSSRVETSDRNLQLIQAVVRPFILRRTKAKVAPELPARSEQNVECELGKSQAKLYGELRDHYRALLMKRVDDVGLARSKMYVLEALLRLRQAAIHPGLLDKRKAKVGSAKLEALLAMLEEIIEEGHKALVYSQFTGMLSFVRTELDRRKTVYEYLDGRTRNREARVDRFQDDEKCPLFLISLKAGGVGLNLTAADYVFILDPWWNPAVEAQAIDRAHRIGQTKCVNAYRLIARNTVEEKIVQLQQSKRELADAIITERNSLIRSLTHEDLAMLLS